MPNGTTPSDATLPIAAVEFGGTKVLVTTRAPHAPVRIPTVDPEATLSEVVRALATLSRQHGKFGAIGVACFGPIALEPNVPHYGQLLNTPKPGWSGVNVLEPLAGAFDATLVLETDVNAAAIGEAAHAAAGCTDYAYITVGTGVGVGLVVAGQPVHGVAHPEAGHLLVRQRPADFYPGNCFAHANCLEGLISGPALEARLGHPLETATDDDPVWDLAGDYLAQLCMALVLTTATARIVIGGGVGARPELLRATRRHLGRHLGGYLVRYGDQADLDALIVAAGLEHPALAGALSLAEAALAKPRARTAPKAA